MFVFIVHQVLKRTVEAAKKDTVESGIEVGDTTTPKKPETNDSSSFIVELVKGAKGLGITLTSKDVITSKTTRIYIKSVLRAGAAFEDGRIHTGDELLSVNNVSVGGKSQADVVKLLRAAKGTVSLKLSRPGGLAPPTTSVPPPAPIPNIPTPSLPSPSTDTPVPSISLQPPQDISQPPKKPVLSPLLKAAVVSHVTSPSPAVNMSTLTKQLENMSPIGRRPPDHVDTPPQRTMSDAQRRASCPESPGSVMTKGCINLTVPLTVQENVGLGISVKGKIMKETGEEKGIFVKSIVPGTDYFMCKPGPLSVVLYL